MPSSKWDLFAGWKGDDTLNEESYNYELRQRCANAINWPALLQHASRLRSGIKCQRTLHSTVGGCHLVNLLRFEDGTQWIVRFQLDPPTPASASQLQSEADTVALIRERTGIPVPQIFGYDTLDKTDVGVPFMLMEYVPGIVAMDMDGGWDAHRGEIAARHKPRFYQTMATLQVEMTSVRMPQIGSIVKRSDGSYHVGPLPGLGGPFSTATEFFKAWASCAKFPFSEQTIRKLMGGRGPIEEVLASVNEFPSLVDALAGSLSSRDHGPFPLYHPDLRHSNIMVDEEFQVLAIIDWEGASTVPWELIEFPLFLAVVPRAMDVAWNYDELGQPVDPDTKLTWRERAEYVEMVREAESTKRTDAALSKTLEDATIQGLANAIKIYSDPGKIGFYKKILEPFQARSQKQRCQDLEIRANGDQHFANNTTESTQPLTEALSKSLYSQS